MDILPKRSPSRLKAPAPKTPRPAPAAPRIAAPKRKKNSSRKKLIGLSLVGLNLLVIGAATYAAFIYSGTQSTSYGVHNARAQETASNPLDTLSAAEIAVNVAKLTGLPEELAVTNQADTIDLYMKAAVIEKEYVTKAQILSGDIKSKEDIVEHVVQEGETLAALAQQYGVTSDSIKWSNDLRTDALQPGAKLFVPPVNGFVYVVGVGDTPEKLAESYNANAAEITAFNDAELKGLVLGDRIVVPNGTKQRLPTFMKFRANYGNNGYWRGYCTWYVASKISVPNNWGNANTWDNRARLTPGWIVSPVPVVGAIAQSNSGAEGHVAIVEAVSADGSMIKYSDMNGLAGWGVEGRTADWVPAHRSFQNFIYRAQ